MDRRELDVIEWANQNPEIMRGDKNLQRDIKIEQGVRFILEALGYNLSNEHFKDTPRRVRQWFLQFQQLPSLEEEAEDLAKILGVTFTGEYDQLQILKHISFTAICAHHLLPFTGYAHIAYIPNKQLVGLSKLARVLDYYASRLTIQETLAEQIALALNNFLDPLGVAVIIYAKHDCLSLRGAEKTDATFVTSKLTGVFRDNTNQARQELLALCGEGR